MIVLDTHAVLWWGNQDARLSPVAAAAIRKEREKDSGRILISAISAWEIAMLVQAHRLDLATDVTAWLETLAEVRQVKFCPVTNEVAVHAVTLPGDFHKDPADRMIVATARLASATLLTADAKIQGYRHVRTAW